MRPSHCFFACRLKQNHFAYYSLPPQNQFEVESGSLRIRSIGIGELSARDDATCRAIIFNQKNHVPFLISLIHESAVALREAMRVSFEI